MHQPGMQKHGGKDIGIRLDRLVNEPDRDQSVAGKQRGGLAGIGKFPEKNEDIGTDQQDREQGEISGWIFVVKREKHVILPGWKGEYDRLWGNSQPDYMK